MNVLEALHTRRAVRDYQNRPVDAVTIDRLLHAAVLAPSAMNSQPWRFIVIQDAARLKRYSDLAKANLLADAAQHAKTEHYRALLGTPEFNIFYNAGTLVTIGVETRGPFSEADAWLAAGNLMLAACEAGLGSCSIGFALGVLNTPEVKQELQIPPEGYALAPILLGYPTVQPPLVPRAEPRIWSWLRR